MLAPLLETPRLTLRGHGVADFDESAALWGDPIVTRHIGGKPFTPEECWGRLLRYAGLWSLLGYGYWAVRARDSGRFVGEVGLADFHREVVPSLGSAPEAGWVLSPWAHGRGLATEATQAILGWYEARFGPTTTVCLIDPDNAGSLRVAAKCGYRERRRAEYKGHPTIVLERPR